MGGTEARVLAASLAIPNGSFTGSLSGRWAASPGRPTPGVNRDRRERQRERKRGRDREREIKRETERERENEREKDGERQ